MRDRILLGLLGLLLLGCGISSSSFSPPPSDGSSAGTDGPAAQANAHADGADATADGADGPHDEARFDGADAESPADLGWRWCVGRDIECGELSADGTTVALSRWPATGSASERRGTLIVLPGGPGASGTIYVESIGHRIPEVIRRRFDVIGIDVRGVDWLGSEPFCHRPSTEPVRPEVITELVIEREWAAWQARVDCVAANPASATAGTVQDAHDLEQIRLALGEDQLYFLGLSYGSVQTWVYATLYPDRVAGAVLDGPVAPPEPGHSLVTEQLDAIEPQLATLDPQIYAQLEGFLDQPGVDAVGVLRAVISALYQDRLDSLGVATTAAGRGVWTPMMDLAGEAATPYQQGISEHLRCRDGQSPTPRAELIERGNALVSRATILGRYPGINPCGHLEPNPLPELDLDGVPPMLLTVMTHDPATPLEGARRLLALMNEDAQSADGRSEGNSVLLEVSGGGHITLWRNRCAADHVWAYFADATLPAAGERC